MFALISKSLDNTCTLLTPLDMLCEGYGVKRYFQQYFSYIVVVSFIGGGNWSTRIRPLTVSGDRH